MRIAKFLGIATVGLWASAGFAQAADMVDEVPQAPEAAAVEPVPTGWGGFYTGLYGGYGKGTFGKALNLDAKGFQGGAFGGYNLQSGGLVYGLDADLGYGGAKGTTAGGVTVKKGVNGALRARLGYDLGPAMIYGAAGGTATRATANTATAEDSNIHLGYTVGAGIDAKVTEKVFLRGEYRYNVFGSKDYNLGGPAASVDLKQHDLRFGVGLQF